MVTMSQLVKIFPNLKEEMFYYKFLGHKSPFSEKSILSFIFVDYKTFSDAFDFSKIQVVKIEERYIGCESGSLRFFLTLKEIA